MSARPRLASTFIRSHVIGFKLYHEALGMPDECRYLHMRMQIEQQRFANFGVEAGILFTDGVLCATLQVNRPLLLAVLAEIRVALTTYAASNGKYEELVHQAPVTQRGLVEPGSELIDLLCLPEYDVRTENAVESTSKQNRRKGLHKLGRSIASAGRNLRTIVTEPRRLVWAKVDRESFEDLIARVKDLNDFLVSLLDTSQIARLQNVASETYLEVIQLHSDIQSLTDLVKALNPAAQDRQPSFRPVAGTERYLWPQAAKNHEREQATHRYLQKLVEIKIRYNEGNSPAGEYSTALVAVGQGLELELADFTGLQDAAEKPRLDTRIDVCYGGKRAWIEWKYTAATDDIPNLDAQQTEDRIRLLASLLCLEKPEEFRAPPCLGYVKADDGYDETRFGFVFERPSAVQSDLQLCTLRDLLKQHHKPSLSDRVKLCATLTRSILNFHAVGWLHKGVRSDNVLYFCLPMGPLDLSLPYVSGFDLARPGIIDSMTEKPWFDSAKDIYRHPFAQSGQFGGKYRKSFDIYSLGIVLLEIAMWKRIEDFIGLNNVHRVRPLALQGIQPWLLGRPYGSRTALPNVSIARGPCLKQVASECGDVFASVVEQCLTMDEMDKAQYPGESESSVAIRVQRITQEDILGRLERMALVL